MHTTQYIEIGVCERTRERAITIKSKTGVKHIYGTVMAWTLFYSEDITHNSVQR